MRIDELDENALPDHGAALDEALARQLERVNDALSCASDNEFLLSLEHQLSVDRRPLTDRQLAALEKFEANNEARERRHDRQDRARTLGTPNRSRRYEGWSRSR